MISKLISNDISFFIIKNSYQNIYLNGDKMNKNKEINLVLQGGGVKGLAYIGALRCLEENNYVIKNIAGSSIGSVIGALIIAGYNSYELESIVNSIDYKMFTQRNTFQNFVKTKGVFSLKYLEKYLSNLLQEKNITYFKG